MVGDVTEEAVEDPVVGDVTEEAVEDPEAEAAKWLFVFNDNVHAVINTPRTHVHMPLVSQEHDEGIRIDVQASNQPRPCLAFCTPARYT